MAGDRLRAGTLTMPLRETAANGLSNYLGYPAHRATQPKIRALADVLVKLARARRALRAAPARPRAAPDTP